MATSLILYSIVSKNDQLNTEQIREEFGCDRVTTDERATDIYCNNPDYYYDDLNNNSVIKENDYNDPSYKSLKQLR